MLIKTLEVGHLEANCYVVTDENTLESAVIDPGDESNTILDYIESNHLQVKAVFLTHGHCDHTRAAEEVREATGAPVYIHKKDANLTGERDFYKYRAPNLTLYQEGDAIPVGSMTFHVLETPGHSAGSVTLQCEDVLFTGDTLFRDSCGRTDLPEGSMEVLMASLGRLANLEGDYEVYPGHMGSTTLERERRFNYYMKYAQGER